MPYCTEMISRWACRQKEAIIEVPAMRLQRRLLCTGGQESPFVKALEKTLARKYISIYTVCLNHKASAAGYAHRSPLPLQQA